MNYEILNKCILTDTQANIFELLKKGSRANRITRPYIHEQLGYDDRAARSAIDEMRGLKIPICATADSAGYWLAESWGDYLNFETFYLSSAKKQFANSTQMKKGMEVLCGQVEM